MHSTPEKGKRTYRCGSRYKAIGTCGGKRVPAEPVEEWVWERVGAILRDPSIIAEELRRCQEEGTDDVLEADLEAAKRALAKVEKQQERLITKVSPAACKSGQP